MGLQVANFSLKPRGQCWKSSNVDEILGVKAFEAVVGFGIENAFGPSNLFGEELHFVEQINSIAQIRKAGSYAKPQIRTIERPDAGCGPMAFIFGPTQAGRVLIGQLRKM